MHRSSVLSTCAWKFKTNRGELVPVVAQYENIARKLCYVFFLMI